MMGDRRINRVKTIKEGSIRTFARQIRSGGNLRQGTMLNHVMSSVFGTDFGGGCAGADSA